MIKNLIRSGSFTQSHLRRDLLHAPKTVSLETYGRIFEQKDTKEKKGVAEKWPLEEFLCLVGLQLEVGEAGPEAKIALDLASQKIREMKGKLSAVEIRQLAKGLSVASANKIVRSLNART